jgi:predicted helicase
MFVRYNYRPFDIKWTYYSGDSKGFIGWPVKQVMQHFLKEENVGIVFKLGNSEENSASAMVTDKITDFRSWSRSGMQGGDYVAPLYLYPEDNGQQTIDQSEARTPNLKVEIVKEIAEKVGLTFTNEKETTTGTFAPIDILDYIYAVLHSPTYREKYKEFLKIDFPRVPYPKDQDTFWELVKLGGEIRQIHLLESPVVEKHISKYPMTGDNIVGKLKYENGNVFINETQYFEGVPEVAWNFYIGGYQPAQKWLKDRKDRELQIDDIRHYLKIIVALNETDR